MKKILIYTGPVQSGKSSRLLSFCKNRKDVGGILSPLIDEKKYLYDISSGENKLLEADADDRKNNIIVIGKYKFSEKIFKWGRNVLKNASTQNLTYLIIDEIGHLELEGRGLSPTADEIIRKNNSILPQLILVVRDTLINQFLEHFQLKPEDVEFFKFD